MVSTPAPERVEVRRVDAARDEIPSGRAVGRNAAGRRDVVGRHTVTEARQHAGSDDVARRRRRQSQIVEERRMPDIGRRIVPLEPPPLRRRQTPPAIVAVEHPAVFRRELFGSHRGGHGSLDFLAPWPHVAQEHVGAVPVLSQRLGRQVDGHAAGQRVGDHKRRRSQVVGAHLRLDPSFKVAIAAEHSGNDQIPVLHFGRDIVRERAAVADTGRTPVAHQSEPKFRQRCHQPGGLEILRHHHRTGRQTRLDPRFGPEPARDGVLCEQTGRYHHARVGGVRTTGDGGDDDCAMVQPGAVPV